MSAQHQLENSTEVSKHLDFSTEVTELLQGPPKQPATARTLARLCCFLRQGFVSDTEILRAEQCGFNLSPHALQASVLSSTRMTDNLRPFAATYIPISDLHEEKCSSTFRAIQECYDLQAEFDLLRSALTAHMDLPVECMETWRNDSKESLMFVFLSRQFGFFYELLSASSDFLRQMAQYS